MATKAIQQHNRQNSMAINFLYMLLAGGIVLGLGYLFGFLGGSNEGYAGLVRPQFMPPDITFSIVWPILYFMMGVSFYLVLATSPITRENKAVRITSIILFCVQLAVNLSYPFIFFMADMYFFAFVWLAILDALVIALIILNFRINAWSAILLIPYLAWDIFATVLNIMIAVYN